MNSIRLTPVTTLAFSNPNRAVKRVQPLYHLLSQWSVSKEFCMASRFQRIAFAHPYLSVVGSLLALAVLWWSFDANVSAQRQGRKAQTRKLTAKQIHESRERLEERVRERARKLAAGKLVPEKGKASLPGPRLEVEREPRAPFGFEADGLTSYEQQERYDQPSEAARFFRRKRLPVDSAGKFTMEDLPLERYFTAEAQMRAMPLFDSARQQFVTGEKAKNAPLRQSVVVEPTQNTWQPLGPGNIGGRTRALVINPQNPNIMYAAGVSGGVWKTTDAGQNWTPIGDRLTQLTVSSLLLDPTNPNVLYVGTGEGVSAFDQDTQGDLRGRYVHAVRNHK
jgi:hypothetical protein